MSEPQATFESSITKVPIPFITRVRIRNYKSIGKCDVELGPLTVLVGRNGAGKSNFLDALRFVVDGLQTSLDHAMKSRGGIEAVRRRSTGHPRNFALALDLQLPGWKTARYGFEVAARREGGFAVKWERLQIFNANSSLHTEFSVENAKVVRPSETKMPPAVIDRLYLVNAAGLPEYREVYDALIAMGFYNLNPDEMKELQSPDTGELLHRDGSNIASVIGRLTIDEPEAMTRIRSYLSKIVPDIRDVAHIPLGPRETLEFRQEVVGSAHPWTFFAASMSDGTLRALGALVAVTQLAGRHSPATLIGIEEPETALHPAAAGALMDALREAAAHTQVLVTSHSPDLLDQVDPESERMLVVQAVRGDTQIAPVDPASLEAIQSHLYTPGEMLRMDQLEPDRKSIDQQQQMRLFDFEDEEDM